ncbi:MAG: ROK family protein, partial [Burkholderiales bacterium]|nr:ROK family protein [Burkholderiales bacterium]
LPDQAVNLGIGVSQSGFFFDVKNQRIVSRGDTEGWQAAHLSARLGESFGLPVWIENDGRAAAAGAMMHGLGVGHDDFFVVLLTRGVGGGAVVGRTLVRGHAGNAGEVAMLMPADPRAIRPTTDSFEQHWRSNMGRRRPTSKAVQDALQAEEPWLRAWLDESARLLSLGLTAICALLDPELIILAGRLPAALREALKARIRTPVASIAGIAAPPARILVDPDNECLEIGASAIPIAKVLGLHRL